MPDFADEAVTPQVRKAAAWAWRLLVLAGAAAVLFWLIQRFVVIVVPLALALILTALFLPAVDWLHRHRVPRWLAVILVFLLGLGALGGLLTFVVTRFIEGLPHLIDQITVSIDALRDWAANGPLELGQQQINNAVDSAIGTLQQRQAEITSGVVSTASALAKFLTGFFITVFTLIVFLHGGRSIYEFVTRIVPVQVRERVRDAGRSGFTTLTGYVQGTFVVALVDGIGIGIGLLVLGIPLALPLASLVFLGAFVPFVGAMVTGFLAVVIAILAKGWLYGLFTLGLVLAVQQLEGNVLQPLIMGRAVRLHPLAVLVALTAGGVVAGIIGVLLAVPLLAFLDHAVRSLLDSRETPPAQGGAVP
ncbi:MULTISPECIES: AI-2E family transporter [Mycobacteriaceae]|uniref:AI-2E family transporter n=1 Tax=Mycolicibacterium parafortuitum TaxID=39692 RepID=A0ACC6MD18_MYCPF|nr:MULTISPECIES: AI-2E family transporter [Mycobacteriaceae]MDZ5084845.1 AI-2E family transporter [Mycolicibacterium parafortuitum]GFM18569.1 integral membrane protein [Mycobacterium sp. PO1]GFM26546.1 integral membrane protein [Mycobacterium sp. PO2]